MSWITVIWSTAAGACVALGVVHLLVWCWNRSLWANLWFAGVATSVAVMAGLECAIMRAPTPEPFYTLHHWGHVTFFFTVIFIVGFVQSYLRTGRVWLIWTLIGLRGVILLLAFVPGPTFNFREVTEMVPYGFLGETLMSPRGRATSWEWLGNLSGLLLVWFVVDAAIRLGRKGDRRDRQRAWVVAIGVCLFILSCFTNGMLMHHSSVQVPYFITLSFLFLVGAMEIELSRDMLQAGHMAEELRENSESMSLAADAAQLALWRWDIPHDVIWVSPNGHRLYGIAPSEAINLQRFIETLHPDDREPTRLAVRRTLEGDGLFRMEYRVVLPDGADRWIGVRGRVDFGEGHQPVCMRGVSIDITDRKAAEIEAAQHRAELAHLTRVTTLSELSGSLAHELNQPLAIILSNAQAAQRLLAQSPPDIAEVSDILTDIVGEDRRAGEVIQRLRALLKRGETATQLLSLNIVVEEVLRLAHGDLVIRGVSPVYRPMNGLPEIQGDRVQLQQLVLNLILNAADAMASNPPGSRHLFVDTAANKDSVRVSVRDEGCGLPEGLEQLFQPFYTTKVQGLGMGLAICRAIATAHGGKLWAEPHPERGAVFHFELPASKVKET